MQKYQNGLAPIIIIGLVILSLAIVGGGTAGYYLLNKNKPYQPPKINQQTDKNSDWKTYKSVKYNFEINYPSDWIIESTIDGSGVSFIPKGFENDKRDMIFRIDSVDVGRESVFDMSRSDVSLFKDILFSGKQAKEYQCNYPCPSGLYNYTTIRIKDIEGIKWGKANEISYAIRNEDYKYLLPIFEKISSSFKFTNIESGGQQQACTMEAKICSDGSAVGRTGPNCEFSACPK
jgi:hypothetical protein